MDGGMVPIVEADVAQKDRRKGKRLHWKEAKLCLAHEAGSKTLSYGGTLQGDVDEAGKQLFGCARSAGLARRVRCMPSAMVPNGSRDKWMSGSAVKVGIWSISIMFAIT